MRIVGWELSLKALFPSDTGNPSEREDIILFVLHSDPRQRIIEHEERC